MLTLDFNSLFIVVISQNDIDFLQLAYILAIDFPSSRIAYFFIQNHILLHLIFHFNIYYL